MENKKSDHEIEIEKNKENKFFAMLSRMKYINRWGLMRNTIIENIAEHSLETAMIAHALAVINQVYFHGDMNADRLTVYALYHDVPEIITGDLPTPVKYFAPEIKESYDLVERAAIKKLLRSMPVEMRDIYDEVLDEYKRGKEYQKLVKAADKLSALIKCVEERKMGNQDFAEAEKATIAAIRALECREADFFMDHFLEAYGLTLDEQA